MRKQLLQQRVDIPPTQRAGFDALICQHLLAGDLLGSAVNVGVYSPIRAEPDLSACHAVWRAQGRQLALPVVDKATGQLHFRAWDEDTPLQVEAFGVAIPPADAAPVQPDVLLIPCVGFNVVQGRPYRLGYGGGFYDRTLAARPCRTIGVAYDHARAVSWMPAPWDMPLSALVMPSGCIVAMASP